MKLFFIFEKGTLLVGGKLRVDFIFFFNKFLKFEIFI